MAFIYFLPGPAGSRVLPSPEDFSRLGLAHAFDRYPAGIAGPRELFGNGPSGSPGLLFAVDGGPIKSDRLVYRPAEQTWRRIPNSPAWVGRWNDRAIEPADLALPELCEGVEVELANGSRGWIAAHARKFLELDGGDAFTLYDPLPKTIELDDSGRWVFGTIKPRFRRLSELAERYREAARLAMESNAEADVVRFEFPEIDELAIASLSANYRIGPAELALLGGYDLATRKRLLDAALDAATVAAWSQKKSGPAAAGSAS